MHLSILKNILFHIQYYKFLLKLIFLKNVNMKVKLFYLIKLILKIHEITIYTYFEKKKLENQELFLSNLLFY